ncbi:hypothetical protein [Paenibacillus sp. R14(2021)]|uniref:hypothetical protein n=1 Tax=Paenibacillus sp. R14(2021) TaxID=2859228 RepID=UPI0035BE45EB
MSAPDEHWNRLLQTPRGSDAGVEQQNVRFIPYFAWANRGPGEMTVWVRDAR